MLIMCLNTEIICVFVVSVCPASWVQGPCVSLPLLRSDDKMAQKTNAFFMLILMRDSKNSNICGTNISNTQTDQKSLEERSGVLLPITTEKESRNTNRSCVQ